MNEARFALLGACAYGCMAAMSLLTSALVLIAIAYFCGSLPFGYWAGKWKGIDIRKHGSGNIGLQSRHDPGAGKEDRAFPLHPGHSPGAMLPVLAEWWMGRSGAGENTAAVVAVCCAAAAVLGHMFTFWLGFKGGKGVATTAGVMLGLAPCVTVGGPAGLAHRLLCLAYCGLGVHGGSHRHSCGHDGHHDVSASVELRAVGPRPGHRHAGHRAAPFQHREAAGWNGKGLRRRSNAPCPCIHAPIRLTEVHSALARLLLSSYSSSPNLF